MAGSNEKVRILYIEDDLNLAGLYKLRMEAEGFEVRHYSDGESALKELKDYSPDLVLCDLMLPRVSGFDLINTFRDKLKPNIPKIVMISALSSPDDIAKAKKLGADDYIVKSQVNIQDVISRLKKMLFLPTTPLNK